MDSLTHYVPIKLRNIDHYFQLIEKINFAKFLKITPSVSVTFLACKYNIVKKQYEMEATLPL